MKKTVSIALVCAAILVVGTLVWLRVGSSGPAPASMDAGRAETLALDFYGQQHAPADSLSNVRVISEKQVTGASGRSAWEVQIAGGVTEPGSSFTYESAMVLDVDVGTGTVTLAAAG